MLSLLRRPAPWPLARLTEEVSNDWARFRQAANSIYDDVTEAQVTVTGTATITNGKMVARPASVNNWAAMNPITFDDNENFFIRVTAKPDAPANDIANMPYMSVFETSGVAETAWAIFHGGPAHTTLAGRIYFAYRTYDGTYITVVSPDVTPYTNTTTVEVVRVNGVISLLVNGVRKAQATQAKGNGHAAFPQMRPFRVATSSTTNIMAGEVWDVQVAKGDRAYVDSNHTVEPVPEYKRTTYSQSTSEKIVAQYGFRRNSLSEEKSGATGSISGNTIMVRGRIRTDNTNASRYELPCSYFGEADFTIECNLRYLAVPTGPQMYILAQYNQGGTTPVADDSWNLQIGGTGNSPGRIVMVWYDGATKRSLVGPTLTMGAGYHCVIERVGTQMTMYIDGVAVATTTFSGALRAPVTNTITSFLRNSAVTDLYGQREIWNVRIAKAALYKGKVLRKATFPAFGADIGLFPMIMKQGAFAQLPWGLSGSIIQLSRPAYNPTTQKLQVPVLHADRVGRVGAYALAGDVLSQTVPYATMGGSGVIRVGAMHSLAPQITQSVGKRATVHTWGASSVPSGIAVGMLPETGTTLEGFTSSSASISGAVTNLNLQAGIYLDPTGSFGLVQYIDGPDGRYLKYRKVRYDEDQAKLILGTSAQEFVGQQYPIAARHYQGNLFLVGGFAATGQTYLQMLDVSGDTPVAVAAYSTENASSMAWYKSHVEVFGEYVVIAYLDSTGTMNVEVVRYNGTTFARVSRDTIGGFATTTNMFDAAKLGDTMFITAQTGTNVDVIKITVRNGRLQRATVDREVFVTDATYSQHNMVKISDTRLLLMRVAASAGVQYAFLDYDWKKDIMSSKVVAQYRFPNDDPVNDVSERQVALFSAANISNSRLNTNNNYASRMDTDPVFFEAGEDFTVEARVVVSTLGAGGAMVVGQWHSGDQSGNSWAMHIRNDGSLGFYYSVDGSNYTPLISSTILYVNREYHLAAYRRDGVIRLSVNGVIQPATLAENRACFRAPKLLSTSWTATNGWLSGWRDSIRITKECLYGAENFVPPTEFPEIERPQYSAIDASAVVLQMGLRREVLQDEASDNYMTFTAGASMANGRITVAGNTTSYYSIPSRKFGAGDFTIELKVNVQSMGATYGNVLMGNWKAGGVASDENRWCIVMKGDRKLSFAMARSAAAGAYVIYDSDKVLALNTDYHVVVERYNGVVTIYVDGESIGSSTEFDFPMRDVDNGWKVHSASSQGVYFGAFTCYDLRIVDKAMYKGNVVASPTFPALPVQEYVIVDGATLAPDWSLLGGAVMTADGASIPVGGYLSCASNPKYVFGKGDFTVEITLTVRGAIPGTGAGAGAAVTTLFCWHTWGAPGQPLNWEYLLNHTAAQLSIGTSFNDDSGNRAQPYTAPIGTKIKLKVVKKRNVLHFFADGRLLGQSAFPINIGLDSAQPIYIGRRRGGGDGSVNWWCNVLIEKYVIAKEARM